MSNPGSQLDIHFPDNLVVPSFFANVVQTGILEDEVYLNFCQRSMEKPLLVADLQCRVVTTLTALRRLNQGLTQLLAQHDQAKAQAQAQAQAQHAQAQHPQAPQPTPQELAQYAKGVAAGVAGAAGLPGAPGLPAGLPARPGA